MSTGSNKQKSRKSAISTAYNDRIKGVETNLLNGGVSTGLIDECRRLIIDLFSDAVKSETEVNDLKSTIKKSRKESQGGRSPTAYQLFCESIRSSVRDEFIATCPHVFEEVTDPATNVVSKVEKIEYVDSKGMKKRCVATGVPITVLQGVFSAKWATLDADAKSLFITEASRLKAEHVAKSADASTVAPVDTPASSDTPAPVVVSSDAPAVVPDGSSKKRKSKKDASPVVAEVAPVADVPAPTPVVAEATTVKKPRGGNKKVVDATVQLPAQ